MSVVSAETFVEAEVIVSCQKSHITFDFDEQSGSNKNVSDPCENRCFLSKIDQEKRFRGQLGAIRSAYAIFRHDRLLNSKITFDNRFFDIFCPGKYPSRWKKRKKYEFRNSEPIQSFIFEIYAKKNHIQWGCRSNGFSRVFNVQQGSK